MKYLKLIAAIALIGGTAVACTDTNYSGRGQYGYNNAPDRNRDGIPDNQQQRPRGDADRDGVPNNRDRAPNNPNFR
ncbi:MAG: hypothetical protein ABIP49_05660 [Lysobacterales bacterium]